MIQGIVKGEFFIESPNDFSLKESGIYAIKRQVPKTENTVTENMKVIKYK